jgi:hypothetical protein
MMQIVMGRMTDADEAGRGGDMEKQRMTIVRLNRATPGVSGGDPGGNRNFLRSDVFP